MAVVALQQIVLVQEQLHDLSLQFCININPVQLELSPFLVYHRKKY